MLNDSSTSNRPPLPRGPIHRLTRPLVRFLHVQSASGIMLLACTAIAMGLANSPWASAVHQFWDIHFVVGFGDLRLDEPLHFWVNDALMALFFFVVGLEIKREMVAGELSSPRKAALPVVAALGGMLVPAGVYLALQHGQPGERAWGVPMATDIAFVVGVLAAFGKRVPLGLKIFLLSLAIADDIGAIIVIALAYSGSPNWIAVAVGTGGVGLILGLNRLGVRSVRIYVLVGILVWIAVLKSGVHPTIAGVILGMLTPSGAWVGQATLRQALGSALGRATEGGADLEDLMYVRFAAREAVSPLERIEALLHPWVGFVIMPIFALANAGVEIQPAAVTNPIALAVAIGLVVGKPLGIVAFSYLAVKLGLASLPTGVCWKAILGAGCLGGIGFTMSLFIAGLALPVALLDAGKVGVLIGSAVSATTGSILLVLFLPKEPPER